MELSTTMDKVDLNSEMRRFQVEPQADEHVFEIIPKHASKFFMPSLIWGSSGVLFLLLLFIGANLPIIGSNSALYTVLTIVLGLLFAAVTLFSFTQWYAFKHSVLIFTNKRIIDAEYKNITSRPIVEIPLSNVKNTQGTLAKPWGHILQYGTLIITQYGMDDKPNIIHHVPSPQLAAEQTMHFHNVVAHGGVDAVHSYQATNIGDDKTPELEQMMHKAEAMAQSQGEPSAATPVNQRGGQDVKTDLPDQKPVKEEKASEQSAAKQENSQKDATAKAKTQPPQAPDQKQPVTILKFDASSDKVGELLDQVPAEKQPTVHYLAQRDVFEIEAIVLEDEAEDAKQKLQDNGATDIRSNGSPG